MFAKLLVVMLSATAVAVALLLNRQQRLDTVHEMSLVHQRLIEHERTLWQMQAEIAGRCRPDAIREAIEATENEWLPIPERLRQSPVVPHRQPLPEHMVERGLPLKADLTLGG